jgi:hypothetical protein
MYSLYTERNNLKARHRNAHIQFSFHPCFVTGVRHFCLTNIRPSERWIICIDLELMRSSELKTPTNSWTKSEKFVASLSKVVLAASGDQKLLLSLFYVLYIQVGAGGHLLTKRLVNWVLHHTSTSSLLENHLMVVRKLIWSLWKIPGSTYCLMTFSNFVLK